MSIFTYKHIYHEDGRKVLEMNILPEKYCNFDCIFCPIGRSHNKIDTSFSFDETKASLIELEEMLENNNVDLVFINSKGEAFANNQLIEVISLIKNKGIAVRLLSNGYLFGNEVYAALANMCDEVIGELKVVSNDQFQKLQRPIEGYTFEKHVANMASFNKQYPGKFIFEITIIKGCNDDAAAVQKLKDIIEEIAPDKVIVARIEEEIFRAKLGISDERYTEISQSLSTEMK